MLGFANEENVENVYKMTQHVDNQKGNETVEHRTGLLIQLEMIFRLAF
jgi:hypothetical protein